MGHHQRQNRIRISSNQHFNNLKFQVTQTLS